MRRSPIASEWAKIRGELEDLAFSYLDPKSLSGTEGRRRAKAQGPRGVSCRSDAKLVEDKDEGARHSVPHRIARQAAVFDLSEASRSSASRSIEVYDLLALRIITDNVKNCYAALGVIHNTWRPVPGRIKDFISPCRGRTAISLCTLRSLPAASPSKCRFVPPKCIASQKKELPRTGNTRTANLSPTARKIERVSWLRHLVEWQQEMKDPADFLSTLKVDLYPEEVYTFTPKGKVITLPRDATPVDFAYAIHTEVGHNCVGAKINGRMVPLKTKLKNGDIVEIVNAGRPQAQPRLALVRQDVTSSQQDPALAHRTGKREGDRTRPERCSKRKRGSSN